ncbi:MAG: UDP-N-acetylglucosamine 1-carboxyvinyltransferase, partial [Pseudomonadota bacterium]|nr:UDP-N-acetylglucosamine 1-carboxyvinyltransferase [Pseudomonadota bacterium]
MDKIVLHGGTKLSGKVDISGAKNAALPLMATALLTNNEILLENIPRLGDVGSMCELLRGVGVEINDSLQDSGCLRLSCEKITNTEAPYDIVRKMRASILILGPLIARCGEARVSLPGGCAIGNRPVDLHLNALMQMGAQID